MSTHNGLTLSALAGSAVAGSAPAATAALAPDTRIEATLVLRRPGAAPDPTTVLPAAEFAAAHGAAADDIALVTSTLVGLGVQVLWVQPAARLVRVAARADVLSPVFGADLAVDPATGYRVRTGELSVPAALAGVVTAVLGLDDRPQARTRTSTADPRAVSTSYSPLDLAKVYDFPAGTDGAGRTIAIVELGGGFGQADLDAYFSGLGITGPTVTAVGVDGAANVPGKDPSGADGEVLLDIEVAGALAPKAAVVVYFAPNTDAGFLDAVSQAAHASPTPAAISISWGQSEDEWSAQARTALDQAMADAATLGVVVTAAAGDDGSTDRAADNAVHADFPASSPHALACGGTNLAADPSSGTVSSETVWNNGVGKGATGGGVSDAFPVPSWQAGVGVPTASGSGKAGRGVPDVAAVADPTTGYKVRVDGQDLVIGGTSAVAPLWAALATRLTQALGTPLGLLQPRLYGATTAGAVAPGFRDITSGTNGAYSAGPGWDACTGLGVPVGSALLAALRGSAAAGSSVLAVPRSGPVLTGSRVRVAVDDVAAALPLYRALTGADPVRRDDGTVDIGHFQLVPRGAREGITLVVDDLRVAATAVVAAGGSVVEETNAGLVARHPDGAVFTYVTG
ncbi:S53 family peptidase [Actinomycetospora chiangmaiensis]|uniref:S53 family peptidase n=1 Tax=Actinomycetospora chiangmaiensis TaxID=402650 RepID=UPI00037C17D7|nr:S53 family peptidase [Actinomycetospora chiangmaiensis]